VAFRITSTGNFDSTFGTNGKQTLSFPSTFTTASNALSVMEAEYLPNDLLIGGWRRYTFTGPGGASCTGCDFTVVALNTSDGQLHSGFGESNAGYTFTNFGCIAWTAPINSCCGSGYPSQDSAYDLLCWESATDVWHIIAVGSTGYTNLGIQFAAARYDSAGDRETTWGPNNNGLIAVASGPAGPTSLAIPYDGDIIERFTDAGGDGDFYAAGVGSAGSTSSDFVAVRWNENGTLDSNFGLSDSESGFSGQVKLDLGTATTGYVDTARGIKIMRSPSGYESFDGMISIGGYTGPTSSAGRIGVAQFLPSNRVTVSALGSPGAPLGLVTPESPAAPSDAPPGATALLLSDGQASDDLLSSA